MKTKRTLDKESNEETETQMLKLQIAQLEDQVKLLTIENNRLRNHMDLEQLPSPTAISTTMELHSNNFTETPRSVKPRKKSHNTQLVESANTSTSMKGCQCKGKCATKQCGCVKKNSSCSKLCKCSSSVCRNQEKNDEEQNKENLENIEVDHVEAEQISNKNLFNVASHRSLFSPESTMISSTPKLEQFSPVKFKSSIKLFKSDSLGGTSEQLNQTIEDQGTNDNFNPMKPKYELLRTPTDGKKFVDSHTGSSSSSIQTPEIMQETGVKNKKEDLQVPEEFNQPEVDWDKYQAQLVPCNKCKRKFHPRRIQKHQDCCKKV